MRTEAERTALHKDVILSLKLPVTTVARVVDHVERVRDVAGIEHAEQIAAQLQASMPASTAQFRP